MVVGGGLVDVVAAAITIADAAAVATLNSGHIWVLSVGCGIAGRWFW